MKCYDIRTNSRKQYHKEHMTNSVEKMHVDVGAENESYLYPLLIKCPSIISTPPSNVLKIRL